MWWMCTIREDWVLFFDWIWLFVDWMWMYFQSLLHPCQLHLIHLNLPWLKDMRCEMRVGVIR